MQVPLQIAFRHMPPAPAIEAHIRERAAELDKIFPRIVSCRVVVEPSSKRQHQGNLYHLRIDLTIPGHEIIVRRDPSEHHAHEDVLVAVRDAFDAARRQLEDAVRLERGDVKHHAARDLSTEPPAKF